MEKWIFSNRNLPVLNKKIRFIEKYNQFSTKVFIRFVDETRQNWPQCAVILPLAAVSVHFSFCHLRAGTSSLQNLLIGLWTHW